MVGGKHCRIESKVCCETQARVRQGSARDGNQGERPQSLKPSLELTLKLVDPTSHHHHHHLPTGSLIIPRIKLIMGQVRQVQVRRGEKGPYSPQGHCGQLRLPQGHYRSPQGKYRLPWGDYYVIIGPLYRSPQDC